MNVVAAAVGSVVPKLLQLLEGEYKLQKGVKKRVESLSKELKEIDTFLCKVSEVPWDQLNEQVKEWASEIREASYDMEDILDTFLVRIEGRNPTGRSRLKLAMNKVTDIFTKGKERHNVGSAIENIMERLQEVAARRDRYRVEDLAVKSAAATSSWDPRLKAMYVEVTRLVGIQKPCNDLIAKLQLSADHERKIVSIFGPGGLGKTTLAKSVYDKLKADFECRAFVPIGRNPNLSRLLMDILYELYKDSDIHSQNRNERQLIAQNRNERQLIAQNRNERQLIDSLREFLMHKSQKMLLMNPWKERIKSSS